MLTMIPLKNNVVVNQDAAVLSKGNLVLMAKETRNNKPSSGTVIAVGKDCKSLNIGDKIKFSEYAGVYFQYENKEYLLMSETEVDVKIVEEI